MIDLEQIRDGYTRTPTKIVMLVVDGLGGLAHPDTGKSELEVAHIPNLNALAGESACGLTTPVLPGVAPGSGPGHLALFGYDPLKYLIGRGALEALGIEVALRPGDVAARGNFCTVGADGRIIDRRAGRIDTAESAPLVEKLAQIRVDGVQADVYPVKDYRFVLVLRGEGLSDQITETDPQRVGEPPLHVRALKRSAKKTADAANLWSQQAAKVLASHPKANMALLRGWSTMPSLPQMADIYPLKPAAIAAYPMYRGLAHILGMDVAHRGGAFSDEVDTLEKRWNDYDFFYLHYKPADAAGEDGDFKAKVAALEALDPYIARVRALKPDVLMVAGDHATPAVLAAHSWHPVPFMLNSRWTKGEGVSAFNERACAQGALGRLPAVHVMTLALSHAGKLTKYGP